MSDDKSDKAGDWFGNPLPIVMVVLLAGGLLVKNVPLESARPTDLERVKFLPTSQQDVEARLWQAWFHYCAPLQAADLARLRKTPWRPNPFADEAM